MRPFDLLDILPDELRGVLLDFAWQLDLLWSLDIPATEVPLDELRWHFDLPLWAVDGKYFHVTPAQVAADPERYSQQYARTLAADLSYPIHMLDRPVRMTILDGTHRLLKAHLLGHETVQVIKVPLSRLPDIASR